MNSAPQSPAAPIQRCDILIIGAGPAGMAAALAAAPSGASIVLVDDNPAPGGQIWRDGPGAHLPPLARMHRERLAAAPNVRVLTIRDFEALAPKVGLVILDRVVLHEGNVVRWGANWRACRSTRGWAACCWRRPSRVASRRC